MTPAGTTLRQATPADRPAIVDTHRAAFGTQDDEIAVLVDALSDPRHCCWSS